MRWHDKPFPECCLHCPAHRLSTGSCGHSQRELLVYYFAAHSDASCPVFGELDIDPSLDNPIAKAIDEGYRYERRFTSEYDVDPRRLVVQSPCLSLRRGDYGESLRD